MAAKLAVDIYRGLPYLLTVRLRNPTTGLLVNPALSSWRAVLWTSSTVFIEYSVAFVSTDMNLSLTDTQTTALQLGLLEWVLFSVTTGVPLIAGPVTVQKGLT